MNTVIISGPEDLEIDQKKMIILVISFVLLAIVNITVTCLMFLYPNSVDLSKVVPATAFNANQLAFVEIDHTRSFGEQVLFIATLLNLAVGVVSAVLRQPLGLATYVLVVLLIFFLGFTSIPYFFYAMRYTLDAFLAYVALVLINRLTVNFLKIHG